MQTDEIVSRLRAGIAKYGHDRIELEFRLGHRALGRFEPGVPRDAWERVKAALDAASQGAAPAFARAETRTLERIHNGHKHVVDEAGGVTGVHKKRLSDVDLEQAGPWDIRASVSLEETEAPDSDPPASAFERRKHRFSYRHKCWSVDLTCVTGNSRELDNDQATYEVEVELADQGELFVRLATETVQWGLDLTRDMVGLALGGKPA
jgi:hypothetical protein